MQHRRKGRILSRERGQRKALLKTLLGSLILHERITTTKAKDKEVKTFIDQVVNKAKRARADAALKVGVIRDLKKSVPDVATRKLLGEFGSRFESRRSGYTRIIKLETRKSDSARMAVIEFV